MTSTKIGSFKKATPRCTSYKLPENSVIKGKKTEIIADRKEDLSEAFTSGMNPEESQDGQKSPNIREKCELCVSGKGVKTNRREHTTNISKRRKVDRRDQRTKQSIDL